MSRFNVADVMTIGAVSVSEGTRYRDVVNVLESRSVSAVPVVDRHNRVVGLISATDLAYKMEFAGGFDPPRDFERRRRRHARRKAAGLLAADLMSSPVVTASPTMSVVAAARLMDSTDVKRLPVVDDLGRLIGMVTRRDLLKVFLRPDDEIKRQIRTEVLPATDGVTPHTVDVAVVDGVVTLTGEVAKRSAARALGASVERLDGVVAVSNRMAWRHGDESKDALSRPHLARP
jgi:CBS domain-containing protein